MITIALISDNSSNKVYNSSLSAVPERWRVTVLNLINQIR